MWEQLRIIEEVRPKITIWENVKSVLGKRHKHNFEEYQRRLEEMGYVNHYKVLNAVDFGIPQKRERVFLVSIRKDIKIDFNFDNLIKKELEPLSNFVFFDNNEKIELEVKQATKSGKLKVETPLLANLSFPNSKTRRGRCISNGKISPTILTGQEIYKVQLSNNMKRYINSVDSTGKFKVSNKMIINPYPVPTISTREGQTRIASSSYFSKDFRTNENVCGIDLTKFDVRKITPLETLMLMGFSEEDYNKLENKFANGRIYKVAGNSIVVDVLEAIFKELFKEKL